MPGAIIISHINARFERGGAGNSLDVTGVLMHNFDEISNFREPWKACNDRSCLKFSDRFACSIIYREMTSMYKPRAGGFVIASAGARILCSYSRDGVTMGSTKQCPHPTPTSCIPGCGFEPFEWCPEAKPWRCAWPPDNLDAMLKEHIHYRSQAGHENEHNEIVLDAVHWTNQLPNTIEAMWFFQEHEDEDSVELSQAKAHVLDVHARFLNSFGFLPADVPLASFNPRRFPPFACHTCS